MADDGLLQPWEGRVWMNPPFSNPTPWVDRWLEHRNGVALLPVTRGKWNNQLWASDAALIHLPHNFKFHYGPGMFWSGIFSNQLAAFGDECVEAISRIGRVR
jgi:hypothetical protein